jgi:hypothetical protein
MPQTKPALSRNHVSTYGNATSPPVAVVKP